MNDDPPHDEREGTPRWVKVFVAVALVVAIAFVVLLVARGEHGPGRHGASAVVHVS